MNINPVGTTSDPKFFRLWRFATNHCYWKRSRRRSLWFISEFEMTITVTGGAGDIGSHTCVGVMANTPSHTNKKSRDLHAPALPAS
jgi:hypothetical protein